MAVKLKKIEHSVAVITGESEEVDHAPISVTLIQPGATNAPCL